MEECDEQQTDCEAHGEVEGAAFEELAGLGCRRKKISSTAVPSVATATRAQIAQTEAGAHGDEVNGTGGAWTTRDEHMFVPRRSFHKNDGNARNWHAAHLCCSS